MVCQQFLTELWCEAFYLSMRRVELHTALWARLQFPVQHTRVANLSSYIVNIETLYTKINSAGNLTSLLPGTLCYISCIFIANMWKNIFVFLHVLLLGFVFISLWACLRPWKDPLLVMSKVRRVPYRPCYNYERRLISSSGLNAVWWMKCVNTHPVSTSSLLTHKTC